MQTLMQQLHVSMGAAGWLMSVFALAGIILAIPAAFILNRFGPKLSGLLGLGCTVLGCIIGALSPSSAVLLFGRVIEGVGVGLIGVISPAVIAMYFKQNEMGLPMGIWSTWVPVGAMIAFNVAAPLKSSFGWQGIWWFGALLAVIAFILYALIVDVPSGSEANPDHGHGKEPISYAEGFKSPEIWLLSLCFFTLMFCYFIFTTWSPTYLNSAFGIAPGTANFYTSLVFIWAIPASVVCGWLLTIIKNHKAVLIIEMALATILYFFAFKLTQGTMVFYIAVIGIVTIFFATTSFTLAPVTMPTPALAGLAMGMIILAQNLASFVGPPIMGSVVSGGDWARGSYPMLGVMIIGLISAIVLGSIKSKRSVKD